MIGRFLAAMIIVTLVGLGTAVSVSLIFTGVVNWGLVIPPTIGALLGVGLARGIAQP